MGFFQINALKNDRTIRKQTFPANKNGELDSVDGIQEDLAQNWGGQDLEKEENGDLEKEKNENEESVNSKDVDFMPSGLWGFCK